MRNHTRFLFLAFIAFSVVPLQFARSQTNFSITIYASDGSGWMDSVTIGKNTSATFGIDAGLGEVEQPPVPPPGPNQFADFRSVDPTGGLAFGQGLDVDLRKLVSDYQRDVYRLSFRRSSPEGTGITLFWQSGLGSVSMGGFYLTDGQGGLLFSSVDMTSQTTFTDVSFNNLTGSFVDIVIGDGRKFRTFPMDSIALAKDSKGKIGKAEKRKPSGSDACFTFFNFMGEPVDELYVEWSGIITEHLSYGVFSSSPTPVNPLKPQKITYAGASIPPGNSTTLCVSEGKGKMLVAKKWYWKANGLRLEPPGPPVFADEGTGKLTYNMPNINNVGEELLVQGAFPIDIGADSVKRMRHFRWKDILKTLVKKQKAIYLLQSGTPFCLDTIAGKKIVKMQKSISPDKLVRFKGTVDIGNRLAGELLALKVNIAASAHGKTPSGFGDLVFNDQNDPSHPYNGQTISQIAEKADKVLSCDSSGLKGSYTFDDITNLLARINNEFNGAFDTIGFVSPTILKPIGGTITTGTKSLVLVDFLEASGPDTTGPVQFRDYRELYDIPSTFSLSQNYPNPFNPTTTIDFTLSEDAVGSLKIYSILGQEVATLIEREELSEGENSVEFDASHLSTGVYYYMLVVNDGEFRQVKKMVLLK